MDGNTQIYFIIGLVLSYPLSRYNELRNSIRDWARILASKNTILEESDNPNDRGIVSFKTYMNITEEDKELMRILDPPGMWIKYIILVLVRMIFFLAGFFLLKWYIPIVFLLADQIIIPLFIRPYTTGAKHGHKKIILNGLAKKMRHAVKSKNDENYDAYSYFFDKLSNTEWKSRNF